MAMPEYAGGYVEGGLEKNCRWNYNNLILIGLGVAGSNEFMWQLVWLKPPSMKAFTGVRLNRVAIAGGIRQLAVRPSLPPYPFSISAHAFVQEVLAYVA
jgi:hypothetical protein